MNLLHALRLKKNSSAARIAIVGAGGKTTALFQLARELTPPVLVASTTHLGAWQIPLADHHVIATDSAHIGDLREGVTLVTGPLQEERTTPLDLDLLRILHNLSRQQNIPLLLECDGSRGLPLKAPAEHEPPIPDFVDTVLVVAGLTGLGQPLDESHVHRPLLFSTVSGLAPREPVTPAGVVRALLHPEGGLKNIPPQARRVCLLNQADTPELQAAAQGMAADLLAGYDSVIIASLKEKTVHAVHERIAGIILAAGESTRFGRPKQLLDWDGEPFVRAVARKALAAGLSPVVVVTGSNAEEVEAAVSDLDVVIVRNEEWQSGQASSITKGVAALEEKAGAAIFLLADQPQVTVEVLRALVERHRREMPAIVAPLILEERRGNPVLFDQVTFPDLLSLRGDVGGRAVFHKHKVEFLPWHDHALLLDVDTPEDYERLLRVI